MDDKDLVKLIRRIVNEELEKFRIEVRDMCMAATAELNDDDSSNKTPRGYLTRKAAAKKYDLVPATLSTWHKDKTVHTVYIGRLYYYNEADIQKRVKARQKTNRVIPEGYLLFTEVAKKLGMSLKTLKKKIDAGKIKGTKRGNRWLFEEDYINKIYEENLKYLSYKQVAELYCVSDATIFYWAKNGRIPAEWVDEQWRFPKDKLPPTPLPPEIKIRKAPKGYLTLKETAEKLGITVGALHYRATSGRITGKKIGSYLYFRKKDVEAELKKQKKDNGSSK